MILYFHRDKVNYQIFYVGIGVKRKRAYSASHRSVYWKNYVNKHGGFIVQIVRTDLSTEQAWNLERYYISMLGKKIDGGQLVNLADGGRTNQGHRLNSEQRKKRSVIAKKFGTKHMMTPEIRAKAGRSISKSRKGRFAGTDSPVYGNKWTQAQKDSIGRKVVCIKTGVVYHTISDAARAINVNASTLKSRIGGYATNKTSLRYLTAQTSLMQCELGG